MTAPGARDDRPPAVLGSSPLEDLLPALPPGFDEIQRSELARLYTGAATLRVFLVPVAAALAAVIILVDPTPWRFWLLLTIVTLLAALGIFELLRVRRGGFGAATLPANLVAMGTFQLIVVFATGGIESPVMPAVLPLMALSSALLGRRPAIAALALLQMTAAWVFAAGAVQGWLPAVNLAPFGGGARAGHADALLWTAAFAYTLFIGIATGVGLTARRVFDAMLHRALSAREDERAARAEHARELTALSGEIAHELKNPLATIKGLGSLLAADATGRSAERLAVLRAEVDRMQGTLEEFLNFSRPLVPLSQVDDDLARLCGDVVRLHEGLASVRGVRLEVEPGPPARVRCDPRKVRQVLINLVQNAIEASARGDLVELAWAPRGAAFRVEVRDRGTGLDAEVDVFAPGVTTKPHGSGVGLTIARALARQHGGELTLAARPGGGCVATLELPVAGASGGESP